jgi:hypothetical protein
MKAWRKYFFIKDLKQIVILSFSNMQVFPETNRMENVGWWNITYWKLTRPLGDNTRNNLKAVLNLKQKHELIGGKQTTYSY